MAKRRRELAADRGGGVWSALTWLGSAAVTALFVGLFVGLLLIGDAYRPGPNTDAEKTVVIPRGSGVIQIGRHLEAQGVVRSGLAFRIAAEFFSGGRSLKAGEYAVPAGASMRDLVEAMAAGRVLLHTMTFPEGLTSAMIVERMAASDALSGDVPEAPPEGALLPETYKVQRGTDRAKLLNDMIEARNEVLAELWAKRQPGLPISTPEEAVILASIVEKETGVADERPRVAAVFVNRLRQGIPLQSDPTVIYGVSQGRALGRGILQSELDRVTPYNTYKIRGLPPTPIANPGRASIAAVLNPPKTTDLFFVADGTGGHAFAATYAEHQRNVARWREIEAQRARAAAAGQ